jgi:hypothetical protein
MDFTRGWDHLWWIMFWRRVGQKIIVADFPACADFTTINVDRLPIGSAA